MAALETPQVTPGWKAVDFHLKGTDGKVYTLADVRGPRGLVVMFICNHCPFVQAIASKLTRDTKELAAIGIGSVAIMSNDTVSYPDDSFDNMVRFKVSIRRRPMVGAVTRLLRGRQVFSSSMAGGPRCGWLGGPVDV